MFDSVASETLDKELAKQGYHATTRLGGAYLGSPTSGGVRIYSRATIVEDKQGYIYQHKVDYLQGADALVDKGIKHAIVSKDGQRFHVMNTHLQASYNDQSDAVKSRQHYVEVALAQLLELKAYVERQKKEGVILPEDKIILCGDFNIPQNPLGDTTKLDQVSLRGDALFNRATILLGPGFELIDAPEQTMGNLPMRSFEPATNTYLQSTQEPMSAKLDLVFSVSATPVPSLTPFLDALVCQVQLALSLKVQSQLKGLLTHQFTEADESLISNTSKALDSFIKCPSVESINAILSFSKSLTLNERISINRLLMNALHEKNSPAMNNKIIEKLVIDDTLEMLEEKSRSLNQEFKRQASAVVKTLHNALQDACTKYFISEQPTTQEQFKAACEKAIEEATPTLRQHRGFYGALGGFLIVIGTLFQCTSWIAKGQEYLDSPTNSICIVGLFKDVKDKVASPNEEVSDVEPTPEGDDSDEETSPFILGKSFNQP